MVHLKANRLSVSRLSRYRGLLCRVREYDVKWMFSEEIAAALGITAAQVRKDFSHFGVTGRRKMGYQVEAILRHLDAILGKDEPASAVLAGFGPLGKSLYKEYFSNDKAIRIVAAFDRSVHSAVRHDPDTGIPVYPLAALSEFVADKGIRIGVITFADKTAQNALDLMVLGGILGILSLSPVELKSPKHCFVNSVNVLREFENVVFFAGNGTAPKKGATV
jgi:redox-sensing transcriptional repressor